MKRFTTIALAVLMVLTVLLSVIPASALEVRGTVVDSGNGDAEANMTWTANNFAAFYYDLNDAATAK
ncbi:MAG: hypothetical protein Q7J10_01140, partial [Methanosarcinaceae archaeon]|nr:hypothetical protein [Methanosarcinaceae archaeon]